MATPARPPRIEGVEMRSLYNSCETLPRRIPCLAVLSSPPCRSRAQQPPLTQRLPRESTKGMTQHRSHVPDAAKYKEKFEKKKEAKKISVPLCGRFLAVEVFPSANDSTTASGSPVLYSPDPVTSTPRIPGSFPSLSPGDIVASGAQARGAKIRPPT